MENSNAEKAVVLLSGGMDSTTLVYYLKAAGMKLELLSIHYGQRHEKELGAAYLIASALASPWKQIDLSALKDAVSASALTSAEPVPHGHYADESMRKTVVPNRNAILLSIAYGYAVTVGAQYVGYAAHAGDHAVYPDCRPEFAKAFEEMEAVAVYPPAPRLSTPFLNKTKADIAKIGSELGVPYALTWSCYEGGEKHCGKCGTCVERREAFHLAGLEDLTVYAS